MAQKILDIQGYIGWEADTMERWAKDTFYQAENVEIRKNLTGVELAAKVVDTGWSINGDILFIESLKSLWVSGGWVVVCTDTGRVYLDWVLKQTINTGTSAHNRILCFGVNEDLAGTQYVYYVTLTSSGTGKIHRSTTDLNTWNISYRTFTTSAGNPEKMFMINNTGIMYIFAKNYVYIMEKNETVVEYMILPNLEEIRGVSMYLWNFRIYTNTVNSWVQYTWDGVSESPNTRQEWKNQPILGIVNDGAIGYAILGFNENYADLYLIQGTQKSELRVNLEASADARVFGSYLSIREGIVYISGGKTGQSDNYGVYTYGNYFPWTPKSLVQQFTLPARVLWHAHEITESYFACTDDKVYKVQHNSALLEHADSGYIVSLVYDGGLLWEEMNLSRIKTAFKLNWWEIKLYVRTTFDGSWRLFKTIDNFTYGASRKCYIYLQEINEALSSPLWSFQEIQFKFELTRAVWVAQSTPILKRFTAWFETTNNS